MHEISLVRTMFKILEEEFPGEMDKVRIIHLSAGLLMNVQPILMQNAFHAVIEEEPRYNKTSLEIEVLPILIHCSECGEITEVKNYKFVCSCGEPGRNIIQGEELLIKNIEFTDEVLE